MYRITTHLAKSHFILVRKKITDGSYAALVVVGPHARHYAKAHYAEKCLEPKPEKKSHRFVYSVLGITLLTGTAIVYAKNTPEVRKWLQKYAPPLDKVVAVAYQEELTYLDLASNTIGSITAAVRDFLFGKEGVAPIEFMTRPEQDLEKEALEGFAPKSYPLPPTTLEPLYVEEQEPSQAEVELEATLVQTEKCEPVLPPPTHITKDVLELEKIMHENIRIAIDNYKQAYKSCEGFNKALLRVIEQPLEATTPNLFPNLTARREEISNAADTAAAAAEKAREACNTLKKMIDNNEIEAPPEPLTQTKRYIKHFMADLDKIEKEYHDEMERSVISHKFYDKVMQARQSYKKELETLFPGIDLSAPRLDVKGELDLLLIFMMKQVQTLQNEIAEIMTLREKKLVNALDCNDKEAMLQVKIEDAVKRDRLAKELEFQSNMLQIKAKHKHHMAEQLRKQAEIHNDVLRSAVQKKEAEIMARMNRMVSEEVEKEQVEFKKQLAAMAGKLKAIEATLKQRQAAEAGARKSQSIWAAAEALLAATRRPTMSAQVDNEIRALEKAAAGDQLVATVVKGIPEDARVQGVATEKALKDRFDVLEQTTYKVALISRDGGSLPMYFLSWLQSKMLFHKLAEIPVDELDNLPTDFSNLDTFDIMQRARYYMDAGELASAARYVNLLQGAARAAARCWLDSARKHLEVRQAAETVMAHAALSGMLYL